MDQEVMYLGKPVTSLQAMLRVISFTDPALPRLIPDGIYGKQTMEAVSAFQKQHGLPRTGITDYATWEAVCTCYREAKVRVEPAEPLCLHWPMDMVLRQGSDNLHVLLLEAMLRGICQVYGNLPDCDLSGVFDDKLCRAVKGLQAVCGMEQTGLVDKALWQQLCGLYSQCTGDGERAVVCGK